MADLRSTLFVGNLSVFCSEQDIEQLFSTYGVILEIRMAKSEDKSKHLSYGFVKFASVASAQLAMHELNGALLCGRPLKIGKAFSRSNKKSFGGPPNEPEYNTASVHVTFISHQLFRIVNEESLRHLFSQFGPVVDAVICKSTIDQGQNRQSGYGFIHFPGSVQGIEASFKAAEVLMDVMIDEVNYKCKISHHLEKHLKDPLDEVPAIEESYLDTPQFPPHLMHLPESVPLSNSLPLNLNRNIMSASTMPPKHNISSNSSVSSGMTTLMSSLTDGSNDPFFEINKMNRSNHGVPSSISGPMTTPRNISMQSMPQQLGAMGRQQSVNYGGNSMVMDSRMSGYGAQQQYVVNSIESRLMNGSKASPYYQHQPMNRHQNYGGSMNTMNGFSNGSSQQVGGQSYLQGSSTPMYQHQQSQMQGMKYGNYNQGLHSSMQQQRLQPQLGLGGMGLNNGMGGGNYYNNSSMSNSLNSAHDLVDGFNKLDLGNYSIIPQGMDSLSDNFSLGGHGQPSNFNSRDFSSFPGNLPPPPKSSPIMSVSPAASATVGSNSVFDQTLGSAFSLSTGLSVVQNGLNTTSSLGSFTGESSGQLSPHQDYENNDLFADHPPTLDLPSSVEQVLTSVE